MIVATTGDLLDDDAEAVVNTVNTVGVSGKGLALQFRQRYPENEAAYRAAARRGGIRLGAVFVVETGSPDGPKWIVNFPTKDHWRSRSRLGDIAAGLDDLVRFLSEHHVRSVAVPPLGCGNGGLDWRQVEPLIRAKLEPLEEVEVRLYQPNGAPTSTTARVCTQRPRLTVPKAVVVALLASYIERAESAATRLVAQKLAYLAQAAGAPLRLEFTKQRFGPYAENLNHLLLATEGHYTAGFGDRSRGSELSVLAGADREARTVLDTDALAGRAVERVDELTDGFESPYGLELLATLHWVKQHELSAERAPGWEQAAELVRAWSPRKANLFTDHHLRVAWKQLESHGWLDRPGAVAAAQRLPLLDESEPASDPQAIGFPQVSR